MVYYHNIQLYYVRNLNIINILFFFIITEIFITCEKPVAIRAKKKCCPFQKPMIGGNAPQKFPLNPLVFLNRLEILMILLRCCS